MTLSRRGPAHRPSQPAPQPGVHRVGDLGAPGPARRLLRHKMISPVRSTAAAGQRAGRAGRDHKQGAGLILQQRAHRLQRPVGHAARGDDHAVAPLRGRPAPRRRSGRVGTARRRGTSGACRSPCPRTAGPVRQARASPQDIQAVVERRELVDREPRHADEVLLQTLAVGRPVSRLPPTGQRTISRTGSAAVHRDRLAARLTIWSKASATKSPNMISTIAVRRQSQARRADDPGLADRRRQHPVGEARGQPVRHLERPAVRVGDVLAEQLRAGVFSNSACSAPLRFSATLSASTRRRPAGDVTDDLRDPLALAGVRARNARSSPRRTAGTSRGTAPPAPPRCAGVVALAVRSQAVRVELDEGRDPILERGAPARRGSRLRRAADDALVQAEARARPATVPAICTSVGVDWAIPLCSTTTSSGSRQSEPY